MIVIIAVVGALYFFIARPDRNVERHLEGARSRPRRRPVTAA